MQHLFFYQLLLLFLVSSLPLQGNTNPFLATDITFTSDVPLSKQEFFHLTGLQKNTLITDKKIAHAHTTLLEKNRFNTINIQTNDNSLGKSIHFSLTGNWLIKKIACRGIAFGKDHFLRKYTQQAGDVFDPTLHEESLNEIALQLNNEGCFGHDIDDELVYSHKDKYIAVYINLNRGKRYLINKVDFSVNKKRIKNSLKKQLYKKFATQLQGFYFTKKHIARYGQKIRSFLKKEGFINSTLSLQKAINHQEKTVSLLFSITTGKKFIPLFKGNRFFSHAEIIKKLSLEEQPDWLLSPSIVAEQITHEYLKKGYWHTNVTFKQTTPESYTFFIEEGAPSYIDSIQAINIQTQQEEAIPQLNVPPTIFDQSFLQAKIQQLETHYITQGYWDFAVHEKRYLNMLNNHYKVLLSLNIGPQRLLHKCEVKGFPELEEHTSFKRYKDHTNIPFNINWLQEQKLFLIAHFQKKGYWYAKVKPEFISAPSPTDPLHQKIQVSVNWNITTGEQVRFGKTLLRGNSALPFKRILREITFKEGDLWSKDKIEQTRKKLKRFDLFKQVHIQPLHMATQHHTKPMALTLIEDDPLELRLRGGYFLTSKNFLFKQQSTPKIGTSLVFRNPTKRADKITIEGDMTRFERTSNIIYQQPSFINLPVTGKAQAYANKYVHPVQIASSTSAYEAVQNGILCSISNEYKNNYYWALTVGNEWLKTSRVRGNLNLHKDMIDKTAPYLFIEPSMIIDTLDDKINTTKGTFSFYSLKMMIPEQRGNITARLMLEQSLFYPIYKKITAAVRIRLGHIFRRSFDRIMPIERFYLGGPYSVRGYEKDALPPFGETTIVKDGKPHKEFTIQGGSSMVNTNLELRFPLFKNLYGVLFQDVGALSQSGFLGFKETWHPSSGFGFRYKTPIGALRFDIGWKRKKRIADDSPYAWYLTFGEAF